MGALDSTQLLDSVPQLLLPYYQNNRVRLFNQDALDLAMALEPDSVDGGIMDPPWFSLCHYRVDGEYGLEATLSAYLQNLVPVFTAARHAFKVGGCLFLVIGDTSNNYSPVLGKGDRRQPLKAVKRREIQKDFNEKEQLSVPESLAEAICDPAFVKHLIEFNLKAPHALKKALRRTGWRHRHTFFWYKGSSGALFDPDSDSAPIDYALIFQLVKFDKKGRLKVNCEPFKTSLFQHRPVSHPLHPCPLPPGLCYEIASHIVKPGDTFLDLFAGSGNTLKAALELGCNVIGNDLNPLFCQSMATDFDTEQLRLPLWNAV